MSAHPKYFLRDNQLKLEVGCFCHCNIVLDKQAKVALPLMDTKFLCYSYVLPSALFPESLHSFSISAVDTPVFSSSSPTFEDTVDNIWASHSDTANNEYFNIAAYLQTTWKYNSNTHGVSNLSKILHWVSRLDPELARITLAPLILNGQCEFTPAKSLTSESHEASRHLTCFIWKEG